MMRKIVLFLLFITFLFIGSLAYAHCLWLNINNDQPKIGEAVHIEIGWGHKFPKDEVIKEGLLNQVYALDSKGTKISLKQISLTEFEFLPTEKGTYMILGNIHPGFLSKTTDGYKMQPKKGLENVLSCFRFDMRAKTIVNVGDKEEMPDQFVGDTLEIIPLKNPKHLKQGEIFPVKVIYDKKPLPSVDVQATYAGFSDEPNTFALSTKTDNEGIARIKISEKGNWLIKILHEILYPDQDECDTYRYIYSFSFVAE